LERTAQGRHPERSRFSGGVKDPARITTGVRRYRTALGMRRTKESLAKSKCLQDRLNLDPT
jgi:hypothetical protein